MHMAISISSATSRLLLPGGPAEVAHIDIRQGNGGQVREGLIGGNVTLRNSHQIQGR